jgi:hypothetical protein
MGGAMRGQVVANLLNTQGKTAWNRGAVAAKFGQLC